MSANPEPTLFLSLTAKDGHAALAFYQKAFGVEVIERYDAPDGGLTHATLKVGDTTFYLSGEAPEWHAFAFPEGVMSACLLCLRVPSCDATYEAALAAGARSLATPVDTGWGSRAAVVLDPFGYRWSVSHKLGQ